jgi:DNA polymerase-3 subunit gamma/tau
LRSDRWQERLQQALAATLGRPVKLVIRVARSEVETPASLRQRRQQEKLAEAEKAIAEDETVRALMETFDARIVPGSVKPTK